jgi:hypothetical protein
MSFGTFKSVEEVVRAYHLSVRKDEFVRPVPGPADPRLQERVHLFLKNAPLDVSEEAICEFLIAPILQEIWLSYLNVFLLWSHPTFGDEPPLVGQPDYLFSKRPAEGLFREPPYVFLVEAKRDDFDQAWAQCLAALLASQKLNPSPSPVYGGVSNGRVWYFGKLHDKVFTQDPSTFTVSHLSELLGALRFLLEQAKLDLR